MTGTGFSKKEWITTVLLKKGNWPRLDVEKYTSACLEVRERIGTVLAELWPGLKKKAAEIDEKHPAHSEKMEKTLKELRETFEEIKGKNRYTLGSESTGKIERLVGEILAESEKQEELRGLMKLAAKVHYLVRMREFADTGNLAGLVHYVEHELPKSTLAAKWLKEKDNFGSKSELRAALKTAREWADTAIGIAQKKMDLIDIPKLTVPSRNEKKMGNAWNPAKDTNEQASSRYAQLLENCACMVMWTMGDCALKLRNSAKYNLQTEQGSEGWETSMKTLYLLRPASAMHWLVDAANKAAGKPITEENAMWLFGGKPVDSKALQEIAEDLYKNSEGNLTRKIKHFSAMLVLLDSKENQKLAEYWENEIPLKAKEDEARLSLVIAEIKKMNEAA